MSNITNFINLRKSPILRSIGIYTFTNFFAKGASFLLLFVFTNPLYILPSENGLLSLFSNSMLFLMPFVSMGIIHSTSTDFFKLGKDDFRSFFTTGFIMPLTVTLFSFIILFFFREQLQKAYGFPGMFVWLIPAITFLTFCNEQLLSLARNNNEPNVYLKANISRTVLELGSSFVLVVVFARRWEGRIEGILIAYVLLFFYAIYYFNKKNYLFGRIKKKYILDELVYAVPIIAMQASIFAMNSSDKFFVSNFTNDHNETVGIYSVACIFASIIIVLCTALLQYVFPKIYTLLAARDVDYGSIKKHFLFYTAVMATGTVLVVILTPLLYHYFINEKYHPALRYTYLLCTGYFLWSVSYFFYSFLLYHKKKKKILGLSFCCIVTSIGCNYFFIKKWHDGGAAFAVVTCYFIVLILTLVFTKEYWQKFIFHNKQVNINN
ncbi:MAG: polysaccharide biosynthesis C-terminal domain-containing protein [Ferruginibacter sp.]